MTTSPTFPSRLIWWRKHRGLSQLQLALAAGCSKRHVSFLELGRTRPSREMVMRFAAEGPVLPMHFQKDDIELHLLATIAPLGTPQDITLQELRIESFFPLDDPGGARNGPPSQRDSDDRGHSISSRPTSQAILYDRSGPNIRILQDSTNSVLDQMFA